MGVVGRKKMMERKNTLTRLIPNRKSVRDHFHDYCSSTSIHGIKYVGERDRPLPERVCWMVILIFCVAGNGYLIHKVWTKWEESPVIVSFAESTTPVWQVPFPAVTICSEVKSRATVFNFSHHMMQLNESDPDMLEKLGAVSLLCDPHVTVDGRDEATPEDIDFLIEVSPPGSDVAWICKWGDILTENCSMLFSQILTDEGFCYTFNMLHKDDLFRGDPMPYLEDTGSQRTEGWSLDGGYSPESPLSTYPFRAIAAGAKAGLFIVMRASRKDEDFLCRGPVQGFKVLLHNPAEFPMVGERYFRAPLNQEVITVVTPNIMTTTASLRSYPPHRRQCYFPSERYLRFFKVYTQRNCELECTANYTLRACGCVSLHMPRVGETKICGPGKKNCTIDAAKMQLASEISASYRDQTAESCDCLPACTSLQYNAESSQANYDAGAVLVAYDQNLTEYGGIGASRISIFFKDMQFTTSRRSELFGVVDFLANCGGLLGLFCGVSLLSLVELVYYVTLRFWTNLRFSSSSSATGGGGRGRSSQQQQQGEDSKPSSLDPRFTQQDLSSADYL